MNAAIRTKIQVFSPNRIEAGIAPSMKQIFGYPRDLPIKHRHAYAAAKFARENSCFGLYMGAIDSPCVVWVPVPDFAELETLRALRSKRDNLERRQWFFNPGPYHEGLKGSFANAIFGP